MSHPLHNTSNRARAILTACLLVLGGIGAAHAEVPGAANGLFQFGVPLEQSNSGSLTVTANMGEIEAEFLLDTGANMVTVNRDLFRELKKQSYTEKVGQVGARLASGKLELMDVYQIEHFRLGDGCELGPVQVAVLPRGGRNLLGMNALQAAAPFAIYTSPPALALSNCSGVTASSSSL